MTRTHKTIAGLSLTLASAALLAAASAVLADDDPARDKPSGAKTPEMTPTSKGLDAMDLETTVADWPEESRSATKAMVSKYGSPDEVTASMLIWYDNGPWKRTVVHKTSVTHNFPRPHQDVLEQVIDYKVPVDDVEDLLGFNGSLAFHRTRGELSSTCNDERANFLALNIAHEMLQRDLDDDEARKLLAQAMPTLKSKKKGAKPHKFGGKLQFEIDKGNTADPDTELAPETATKTR